MSYRKGTKRLASNSRTARKSPLPSIGLKTCFYQFLIHFYSFLLVYKPVYPFCYVYVLQGRLHQEGQGAMPSPTSFLPFFSEKIKGNKGEKERVSKQKLWKGCHEGQIVTVLAILERLELKKLSCHPAIVQYFSVFHSPSTFKSISLVLILWENLYWST